jgi:hypothetical protein
VESAWGSSTPGTAAYAAEAAPSPARAFGERWDVGLQFAYGLPGGRLERGSFISDTTPGILPLQLDVAYRLGNSVAIAAYGVYGFVVPSLCSGGKDCAASIGHDVSVGVRGRYYLPRAGPISPRIDLGVGYEWFESKLSDKGTTSSRSYRGPVLGSIEVFGNLLRSSPWMLGPALGASFGVFAARTLEAGAWSSSAPVDRTQAHGCFVLGVRVGRWL